MAAETKKQIGRKVSSKKIMKIERAEGLDEMNLMEYPFFLLAASSKAATVIHKKFQVADPVTGKLKDAEWRVAGDPEMGLPRPTDLQLFLALMALSGEAGWPQLVRFSRHELINRLEWPHNSKYYQILKDGLARLKAVDITAENCFFDVAAKRHADRAGFGIINDYQIFAERPGPKSQNNLPLSYFEWNAVFYKSVTDGFIRSINFKLAVTLRPTALALYRYLCKKSNNPTFEIGLQRLCSLHLNMSESTYPSVLKQRLAAAHEELVGAGFLSDVYYEDMTSQDGEKVVYVFNRTKTLTLTRGDNEASESAEKSTGKENSAAQRDTPNKKKPATLEFSDERRTACQKVYRHLHIQEQSIVDREAKQRKMERDALVNERYPTEVDYFLKGMVPKWLVHRAPVDVEEDRPE